MPIEIVSGAKPDPEDIAEENDPRNFDWSSIPGISEVTAEQLVRYTRMSKAQEAALEDTVSSANAEMREFLKGMTKLGGPEESHRDAPTTMDEWRDRRQEDINDKELRRQRLKDVPRHLVPPDNRPPYEVPTPDINNKAAGIEVRFPLLETEPVNMDKDWYARLGEMIDQAPGGDGPGKFVAEVVWKIGDMMLADPYRAMARYQEASRSPAGASTEETIRAAVGIAGVAGMGSLAAPRPRNSLGTFGGGKGAQNMATKGNKDPIKAIELAYKLEDEGASPQAIRQATNELLDKNLSKIGGVTKDASTGNWLFEIDDSKMVLTNNFLKSLKNNKTEVFKLGEVIDHPDLFKAYPNISKDTTVTAKINSNVRGGAIQLDKNKITVTGANPQEIKQMLAHEIQHRINKLEGLEMGADTANIPIALQKIAVAERDRRFTALTELKETVQKTLEESGIDTSKVKLEQVLNDPNVYARRMDPTIAEEFLYNIKQLNLDGNKYLSRYYNMETGQPKSSDVLAYERMYGEVQARNAERRLGLNAKERREIDPKLTQDYRDNEVFMWSDVPLEKSLNFGNIKNEAYSDYKGTSASWQEMNKLRGAVSRRENYIKELETKLERGSTPTVMTNWRKALDKTKEQLTRDKEKLQQYKTVGSKQEARTVIPEKQQDVPKTLGNNKSVGLSKTEIESALRSLDDPLVTLNTKLQVADILTTEIKAGRWEGKEGLSIKIAQLKKDRAERQNSYKYSGDK